MTTDCLPHRPDRQMLLPQAVRAGLLEDHLIYLISDVVRRLDLSESTDRYDQERCREPSSNIK